MKMAEHKKGTNRIAGWKLDENRIFSDDTAGITVVVHDQKIRSVRINYPQVPQPNEDKSLKIFDSRNNRFYGLPLGRDTFYRIFGEPDKTRKDYEWRYFW